MILYYAVGGGLGHLTRARGIIHTLALAGPVTIVTASPFAGIREVVGDAGVLSPPPELARDREGFRSWLAGRIEEIAPTEIFIDTFPAGILGELCAMRFPAGARLHHVARILRWPEYLGNITGDPPSYETTYRTEPLTPDHESAMARCSREIVDITITDPADHRDPRALLRKALPEWREEERQLWLAVHSEPAGEMMELIDYAREMATMEGLDPLIALVTPFPAEGLPPELPQIHCYPSSLLFPIAGRIITGCGFNAMRQTRSYRDRHRYIPFPRRYDDQFLRAARRRETSRETAP